MAKILKAQVCKNRIIEVLFDDGTSGSCEFDKFFTPRNDSLLLADNSFFEKMFISSYTDTITWPNGYDICPDVIYSIVSGKEIVVDGVIVFNPNV